MKIFHFHLEDVAGNKETLACNLKDGALRYVLYRGHGSQGTPFALSNIQYYDLVNGDMHWKEGRSLPVETLEDETRAQFIDRVKKILKHSTRTVVHEVAINVTFKSEAI